jgi:hydroxymethylpyrimidine pyrophosphatase-like HAD family hydrolase
MLIGAEKDISDCYHALMEQKFDASIHLSGNDYLEITNADARKELAVEDALNNIFKIDKEDAMALGDNYNDEKMLEYVGCGVAMGNAPEQVKLASDFVTNANAHNGVAYALRNFILNDGCKTTSFNFED